MDIRTVTVTARDLGVVLSLTERRVHQLAREGLFVPASRGRYPLVACVSGYVTRLVERGGEDDELRRAHRIAACPEDQGRDR